MQLFLCCIFLYATVKPSTGYGSRYLSTPMTRASWETTPRTSSAVGVDDICTSDGTSLGGVERRRFVALALAGATSMFANVPQGMAYDPNLTVERSVYLILRVQEATQQETRLVTTGKFKDLQRANIK